MAVTDVDTQVEVLDQSLDKVAIKGGVRAGEPVIVARLSRLMTLATGTKVVEANNSDAKLP